MTGSGAAATAPPLDMDEKQAEQQAKTRKIRTGWILASVAVAFFIGMILRHWVK